MGQMDSIHFCRFKSNSPGKLIDTVTIHFVHESFINVVSDSSPENDNALSAQMRRGTFDCSQCAFTAAQPLPGLLAY